MTLEPGQELNILVAEKVMRWQRDDTHGQWITPEGWRIDYPEALKRPEESDFVRNYNFSGDIAAAWKVVKCMATRMGYDSPEFSWQGPLFKPEHRYLTQEGYPLGTTCWYVIIEIDGRRDFVCASTPEHAICLAALKVVGMESIDGEAIP